MGVFLCKLANHPQGDPLRGGMVENRKKGKEEKALILCWMTAFGNSGGEGGGGKTMRVTVGGGGKSVP